MRRGNVFTIPPGAAFLKVLAEALCDGRLVNGFRHDSADPLSLASVTIYLPTRRAARVLRSDFVDLLGGRSAILPVIRPLGEVDDDAGYFDEPDSGDLDMLPPVSGLTRLVELARLVLAWRNQLPKHLLSLHDDSPLVAPASPADAIWLARSLIELIDAVETEETGWEGVEKFSAADRALWWELSGEFIRVASAYWPARLAEINRSSPALHRNLAIRAEAARIGRDGARGPVIVAGSTGSIPATADLIAAIHSLHNGAVVLPGLDSGMAEADWQLAGAMQADFSRNTDPASRSHPQYGLFHLLGKLKVEREDVIALGGDEPAIDLRIKAVSEAFLPSQSEVHHHNFRSRMGEALTEAFADMALVEAANEREEALAVAIALKLGLEDMGPASQAALITPDRVLARRVTSELLRFGIEADDSAGTPLSASQHGSLLTPRARLHAQARRSGGAGKPDQTSAGAAQPTARHPGSDHACAGVDGTARRHRHGQCRGAVPGRAGSDPGDGRRRAVPEALAATHSHGGLPGRGAGAGARSRRRGRAAGGHAGAR